MSSQFLSPGEVNLIVETLGPARMVERAREFDKHGQAVMGARAAWYEARDLVRGIIGSSGEKAGCPSEDIQETIDLFDLDGGLQAVSPVDLPFWRSLATLCSPNGPWPVISHVWMPFQANTPRSRIRAACLLALTSAIQENPRLNRAYLDGAIWQRHSPQVMVPVRFGPDDLGAVVVDARGRDVTDAWGLVRDGRAALLKARDHPLSPWFEKLLAQWVWHGFISSPAGALLSDLGGSGIYNHPTPAFVAANGIPISIVVGDVQPGNEGGCWVGVGIDHRLLDPAEVGPLHRAFDTVAPELLAS